MPDGAIRVAGTRVSLETVVGAFDAGATAEEFAQQYPSLKLADVYAVISYVLIHRGEVDEYVRTRTAAVQRLRAEVEQQTPLDGIRARLLSRRRTCAAAMTRFLADEDFSNDILRSLARRLPGFDVVRVQDLEIRGASDEEVLAWAARERRLVLTHDVNTLLAQASRRTNLNAYAERFVRSVRTECLDHLVSFGEAHLRAVLREYVEHYDTERPHQGIGNVLIRPAPEPANDNGPV